MQTPFRHWSTFALVALLFLASHVSLANAKIALAHFMVQSSYAYNVQQWKDDMVAAKETNIDGFALNWTPPDCQKPYLRWKGPQIDQAFEAAEATGFLLTHSFDMSYQNCDYFWNTTYMSDTLGRHASSSANLRWDNKIVVTTFGGDSVRPAYDNGFFQDLKEKTSSSGHDISLVPAFNQYSQRAQDDNSNDEAKKLLNDFRSIDGFFNWQAWPLEKRQNLTTDVDIAFQDALRDAKKPGPYIMAISPWQFKNSGPGGQNWLSYGDTLFPSRLASLATGPFSPDMIELISWNDYGESHYLRDLPSPDEKATDYITYASGMQNYILGMSHAPWRILAAYYIAWWKKGTPPAVERDRAVFWYRRHPKSVTCTAQLGTGIGGSDMPDDAVFIWALVKESATVVVDVGGNKGWKFIAKGGVPTMGMVPFPKDLGEGAVPEVRIVRNTVTVAEGKGTVSITGGCRWYNFNAAVALAEDVTIDRSFSSDGDMG